MASSLAERLRVAGAQYRDGDAQVPTSFGSVESEYWAIKEAAGIMDLSHRGRLLVHGKDAPRFLHGMVTNDVKAMIAGQGLYAFVLDAHGHILADTRILRTGAESFLLDCDAATLETVRHALVSHIIADKVKVEDQTQALSCVAMEGPCAREVLREAIQFDPPHMLQLEHLEVPDLSLRIAWASLSGENGYWVWAGPEAIAGIWERSVAAGTALGARPVGEKALEICRIEAGLPRYGTEMNEKTLPQETSQMYAISFTKGCYIGQEVVERIRSRGHVNRRLAGLLFEGVQEVRPGMEISANGQPAGSVTSTAYSYGLRRAIALAMIRTECSQPGTIVGVGSTADVGSVDAEVASLPFFYPLARNAVV